MTYSLSQFSWTSNFSMTSVMLFPSGRLRFSLGILRCEGFIPRNWSFSLTKSHSFCPAKNLELPKETWRKKTQRFWYLMGLKCSKVGILGCSHCAECAVTVTCRSDLWMCCHKPSLGLF